MTVRQAVQLRKSPVTATAFERLRKCGRCGAYSILQADRCPACDSRGKRTAIADYAATRSRPGPWLDMLGVVVLAAAAFYFAGTLLEQAAAILGGALLAALLVMLRRRYKPYIAAHMLNCILVRHTSAIREGLQADMQLAVADMKAEQPKEAYEKLREIGYLLRTDKVKARKIACLNRFHIRKDMELELEQVMPETFNEPFVQYLWEVVKVNKQLVRPAILDYVLANRYRIEAMENGKAIMTAVAGAALRMKAYVQTYPHLFVEYLDELPKERFQRLCRLVADTPVEQRTRLYQKCKERAQSHYALDPDFQQLF
ncbi:hypothetical protein ACFFNY_03800 [Paenibacillus hodogayensis]|uniref:Uncharacterized protein n=1 Tax=Paenibacillus hodogayensis TaxID=279208 RepID=A0ABV5VQZ1_9BACL